jgi:hypothetical protein
MIVQEEKNPLPILLRGAGVLVKPVTGAPGDGNEALRMAIITGLRISDVKVTEDSRQSSLILTGHVSLKSLGYGLDEVLVIWSVLTMDGFEVGRATQANRIPKGMLDDLWGEEANKIAEAALIGIKRIIGLSKKSKVQSIKDTIGQPKLIPDLEQTPNNTVQPLK